MISPGVPNCEFVNPPQTSAKVKLVERATPRTVSYLINTRATKASLGIPYAVAVDGKVLPEYEKAPRKVSGNNGRIKVENLKHGARVTLYLNSDAHPEYRKKPVYEAAVGIHDVEVWVTEKTGKHGDKDTLYFSGSDTTMTLDVYKAALTGDIWMKVTHKYTADEVDALIPKDTLPEVRAAVKKVCDGLSDNDLTISIPKIEKTATTPETAAKKVVVTFNDSDNPKENISSGYKLLTEGLPRVHPAGYAALFTAALAANAPTLVLSSAWRPCLGSIAHRSGLGLDVSSVGGVPMNRQELRGIAMPDKLSPDEKQKRDANVSEEEKKLLKAFEDAKVKEAARTTEESPKKKKLASEQKDLDKARKAEEKAQKAWDKVKAHKTKGPPALKALDAAKTATAASVQKHAVAEAAWKEANEAWKKSTLERASAEKAWCDERDRNQPAVVSLFRASLASSSALQELYDPWMMDGNARDKVAATSNLQKGENETLHAHHLHMTVYEPKILSWL